MIEDALALLLTIPTLSDVERQILEHLIQCRNEGHYWDALSRLRAKHDLFDAHLLNIRAKAKQLGMEDAIKERIEGAGEGSDQGADREPAASSA